MNHMNHEASQPPATRQGSLAISLLPPLFSIPPGPPLACSCLVDDAYICMHAMMHGSTHDGGRTA